MPPLQRTTQLLVWFVALAALASLVPSPWHDGRLLDPWPSYSTRPAEAPTDPVATAPSVAMGTQPLRLEPRGPEAPAALPGEASGASSPGAQPAPGRSDPGRDALAARIRTELGAIEASPVPIVRPCLVAAPDGTCRRRALDRYLEQLARNALGTAQRPARFTQLGDSLVLGDGFTGELRRLLAPWFGDGGHGFYYAGHPERVAGSEGPQPEMSDQWRVRSVVRASERDPLFGIAGVAFYPEGSPDFGVRSDEALPQRLGMLWLPRVSETTLQLRYDGVRSTAPLRTESGHSTVSWIDIPPGTTRLRVSGLHTRSVYYGFVLENPVGSVVDNMGLVSGNVDRLLRIDAEHWRDQVRARGSDVVSFFYGVNSVDDGLRSAGARHREEYHAVLERFRTQVPERDCLVIGLLTRGEWVDGAVALHPGVAALVEAQRAAAADAECAFWSAFEAAGGAESARAWYRARPQLLGSDLAHPTRAGYVELARRFHHALLRALLEYLEEHPSGPAEELTDVVE